MVIESLKLENFRNYQELRLRFDPGTNIFFGNNAQGKTNILESIYLCGTTKSHKGSKDKEEMLILSILSTEDCYGYQLSLLIKDYSQGKISLPEGSLYPALYKLVDNGLISDEKRQVGKRLTRVYYHMEPEGKDYLNQLIEEYNSLHSGIQSILNKTKEGDELTHVQKTQ